MKTLFLRVFQVSLVMVLLFVVPTSNATAGLETSIDPTLSVEQINYSICDEVSDVPKVECESLVALFENTNGYEWTNKDNWLYTTTVDDWFGVTVSNGYVTLLTLYSNNLDGSIPQGLGNLTELTNLDLSDNHLTGSIPANFGGLTKLTSLSLYKNSLSGSIPEEFGNLSNLQMLLLDTNELSGNVPSDLGNLLKIVNLSLHTANLSGSIPLSFTNLTLLDYFYFYDTYLCEPETPEFLAWKATVEDWRGTDRFCSAFNIYLPCIANF